MVYNGIPYIDYIISSLTDCINLSFNYIYLSSWNYYLIPASSSIFNVFLACFYLGGFIMIFIALAYS